MISPKFKTLNSKQTQNSNIKIQNNLFWILSFVFWIYLGFRVWGLGFEGFAQEVKESKPAGKIAYCQHDGSYWQIWTMDLPLYSQRQGLAEALAKADFDGSNKKQLTNSLVDKRSPAFSSDGQKIAYATNEGELWVMDSNGSNQTKIRLSISAREPRWCFEDKRIVFTSYRGVYFLDDSDIWMMDIDGSNLEKIIRRPSLQFLPAISGDNKEMLFVDVLETSSHEIFTLDLKTQYVTRLTDNSFHDTAPVFSPDKSMVAYACDKDGNYDIWRMEHFGQNKKNLTHHPAFDSSPEITNDGKTIFFLSDRKNGMQIWRMDIDGKNPTQITDDENDKQDISLYTEKVNVKP